MFHNAVQTSEKVQTVPYVHYHMSTTIFNVISGMKYHLLKLLWSLPIIIKETQYH
jgi:hypothetical protein